MLRQHKDSLMVRHTAAIADHPFELLLLAVIAVVALFL
jgi:hypothetical protein